MHRINTPNRALALYGAGKDGWRDGVMASGILPTEFNAAFLNTIQEEISGVVEGAGLALNPATNNQLLIAIENLIEVSAGNYVLDTGVANAYVIALNPVPPARANGQVVRFRVSHANTASCTINDGFGVIPLLNDVGGALAAGDLPLGSVVTSVFDSIAGAYLIVTMVPSQAFSQAQADARYAPIIAQKQTGEIFAFSGSAAPSGSLICPPAPTNVSRTTYAALFAAISTTWGAGDGATTFGLPWLPTGYTFIQGSVGLQSVGQVINHVHPMGRVLGGYGGLNFNAAIGMADTYPNTGNPTAGGVSNLAAGVGITFCVKY